MDQAEHEANIRRNLEDAARERAKAEQRTGQDREVEKELQTVRPGSDARPPAGITGSGSGADAERG